MTNTKHFKKWVCNFVKTLIVTVLVIGIALGISTSYDLGIILLSVILIGAGFYMTARYNKSKLFWY